MIDKELWSSLDGVLFIRVFFDLVFNENAPAFK